MIGETLVRATAEHAGPVTIAAHRRACRPGRLRGPGPRPARLLGRDQLRPRPGRARAAWRGGPRPRSQPRRPSSPRQTGADAGKCEKALQRTLQAGSRARDPQHRPAAVRVPAAPVPVQGRHGLRHARGRVHAGTSPATTRSSSPARTGRCCCRWRSAANAARSTWWSGGGTATASSGYTARRDASVSDAAAALRRLPLRLQRPAVAAGPGDRDRRPPPARVLAGGLRPHRAGRGPADGPQVPARTR